MTFRDTFVGALTLKNETFLALRSRGDVFMRGFAVLLVTALVLGAFAYLGTLAAPLLPPPSKGQIEAQALANFDQFYSGPEEMRLTYRLYTSNIASMIYELSTATPIWGQAGQWLDAILGYVGQVLALPWSLGFAGWLLFTGLFVQLTSRWLGGRAGMAQMLGLTALAAAPQIFAILAALLNYVGAASGLGLLGTVAALIGFVIALWGAVIYIKATAIAQQFSVARAIGAIVLAWLVVVGLVLVLGIVFGVGVSLFLLPIARGA